MIDKIFKTRLPVIGYVQLAELTIDNLKPATAKGILDAMRLEYGGIDGIVIENYAEPEISALAGHESKKYMENICLRINEVINKNTPIGINVLPADLVASIELANRYNLDFVHAETYADSAKSRETGNLIQVDLDHVSQFRKRLSQYIPIIATIKPWHVYDVCGDEDIEKSALRSVEYGANALIIVGKDGSPPEVNDIKKVKSSVQVPVGAGSGINDKTIEDYLGVADFFLVSGFFKHDGIKSNPVDEERVKQLMKVIHRLRR